MFVSVINTVVFPYVTKGLGLIVINPFWFVVKAEALPKLTIIVAPTPKGSVIPGSQNWSTLYSDQIQSLDPAYSCL